MKEECDGEPVLRPWVSDCQIKSTFHCYKCGGNHGLFGDDNGYELSRSRRQRKVRTESVEAVSVVESRHFSPITVWYRKSGSRWEHNHVDDGHFMGEQPVPWKGGTWRKVHTYWDDSHKIVYPDDGVVTEVHVKLFPQRPKSSVVVDGVVFAR